MNLFQLKIFGSESLLFDGEVAALFARAADGEVGILANHAPLLSILAKGMIRCVKRDNDEITFESNSGILEVYNNQASIYLR